MDVSSPSPSPDRALERVATESSTVTRKNSDVEFGMRLGAGLVSGAINGILAGAAGGNGKRGGGAASSFSMGLLPFGRSRKDRSVSKAYDRDAGQ